MTRMLRITVSLVVLTFGLGIVDSAGSVGKDGTTTTAIHGTFQALNSIDYYGSGNDDAFAEYGMTTFNFSAADFGGTVLTITSATLSVTVNDRAFSDGDMVEIFFTPDTEADLGGSFANVFFDPTFVNGINPADYVNPPVSLGVFSITEMAGRPGGEVDTFALTFSVTAELQLVNAINTGTDFQIIVAATQPSHDVTYSGVGNTFDPGDPHLEIITDTVIGVESNSWGAVKSLYKN